jgi:hypothetical protein
MNCPGAATATGHEGLVRSPHRAGFFFFGYERLNGAALGSSSPGGSEAVVRRTTNLRSSSPGDASRIATAYEKPCNVINRHPEERALARVSKDGRKHRPASFEVAAARAASTSG